jgi:hypothetical protein
MDHPQKYLTDTEWTKTFGTIVKQQIEDYGMLTSLRVWYESGLEIEYGFTTRAWVKLPLDKGTKRVIDDGMKVLFERIILLSQPPKITYSILPIRVWPSVRSLCSAVVVV